MILTGLENPRKSEKKACLTSLQEKFAKGKNSIKTQRITFAVNFD